MPYESGDSSSLLWQSIFFVLAIQPIPGMRSVGAVPGRGRVLATRGSLGRRLIGAAWAAGVVLVAGASLWNLVGGYWWLSSLLAVAAISWGWALVENVRRRDDPPRDARTWPTAYRYVSIAGMASPALMVTTWVAADLLDGDWADALPGLVGWCVAVTAVIVATVRSRRAAREHRESSPLRRDAGHGELNLRRPPNRWAFGLVLAVHLDSHLVAELRAGESSSIQVGSGEHDLAFVVDGMGLAVHRVDVSAGQSMEVELVLDENDVTVARIPDGPLSASCPRRAAPHGTASHAR